MGSKKTGINPDNVATPIAASFGDLITLAILAWISQGLYNCLGKRERESEGDRQTDKESEKETNSNRKPKQKETSKTKRPPGRERLKIRKRD